MLNEEFDAEDDEDKLFLKFYKNKLLKPIIKKLKKDTQIKNAKQQGANKPPDFD
jgi:hypothetical protein